MSPEELQSKLNDPPGIGTLNSSKGGAVGHAGIRLLETHLVKGVEELRAEFEPAPFFEREVFQDGEVCAVQGGPRKDVSTCCPVGSQQVVLDPKGRAVLLFNDLGIPRLRNERAGWITEGARVEELIDHRGAVGMIRGNG